MLFYITELFDKPLKYDLKKISSSHYRGEFITSDNIDYHVNFLLGAGYKEIWIVSFELASIYKALITLQKKGKQISSLNKVLPTGIGKEIEVYSTVLNIVKEFVEKISPKKLTFSAMTKEQGGLYRKFIKRFANKIGYSFEIVGDYFYLYAEKR